MHIGIAGIGNMGSNIGARLMEVGHTLTVWNRTAEKTKPLADAGADVVKTPAELTGAVDVVTVGQAYHWFDQDRANPEIWRILADGGHVIALNRTVAVANCSPPTTMQCAAVPTRSLAR